jgi:hypothetical protein
VGFGMLLFFATSNTVMQSDRAGLKWRGPRARRWGLVFAQ